MKAARFRRASDAVRRVRRGVSERTSDDIARPPNAKPARLRSFESRRTRPWFCVSLNGGVKYSAMLGKGSHWFTRLVLSFTLVSAPLSAETAPEPPHAKSAKIGEPALTDAVPLKSGDEEKWRSEGTRIDVPGDAPALVFQAPPGVERAIVYLHGRCGRPDKIGTWAGEVSRFGTIIALRGDRKCSNGGHYWSYSFERLSTRIRRAVDRVSDLREGRLDTERVTLVGYSEGAARAEHLPRLHPKRYQEVILIAAPTRPHPWVLEPARAVVIIGGQRDRTRHLRQGHKNLLSAGQLSRYLELPGARHGQYGGDPVPVMASAFDWLYGTTR